MRDVTLLWLVWLYTVRLAWSCLLSREWVFSVLMGMGLGWKGGELARLKYAVDSDYFHVLLCVLNGVASVRSSVVAYEGDLRPLR